MAVYRPGDDVEREFTTTNPSTGASANASLLTVVVAKNGTVDTDVTVTTENLETGRYRFTFTIPDTYAAGDDVSVRGTAVVGGITGRATLWETKLQGGGCPSGSSSGATADSDAPTTDAFCVDDDTGTLTVSAPLYVAKRSYLFQNELMNQVPAAVIPAGDVAVVQVPLTAPSGRPAVISSVGYCGDAALAARFAEAVKSARTDAAIALYSDNRSVVVALPEAVYTTPGVYELDVRVRGSTGFVAANGRALVYVESSNWSDNAHYGPPRVDEIRSAIRDYPASNRLLGDYEFSDAEIAGAVTRSVRLFNSSQPQSGYLVTTSNWPRASTTNLIDGVLAELFAIATAFFRRGMLPYSSGGLEINDMAKEKDYLGAVQAYRQRYDKWVAMVKMANNMDDAFGTIGTDYADGWGY